MFYPFSNHSMSVIAADRCYVAEMIEHGRNGILVQDGRPQTWSAAHVNRGLAANYRDTVDPALTPPCV